MLKNLETLFKSALNREIFRKNKTVPIQNYLYHDFGLIFLRVYRLARIFRLNFFLRLLLGRWYDRQFASVLLLLRSRMWLPRPFYRFFFFSRLRRCKHFLLTFFTPVVRALIISWCCFIFHFSKAKMPATGLCYCYFGPFFVTLSAWQKKIPLLFVTFA